MSAPEGIVSWGGSLLKERALHRGTLWGEALWGARWSDAASFERREELSNRVQTLADRGVLAYALRGEKLSEPARQAARFVIVRMPGVPSAGRWWTISSGLW